MIEAQIHHVLEILRTLAERGAATIEPTERRAGRLQRVGCSSACGAPCG